MNGITPRVTAVVVAIALSACAAAPSGRGTPSGSQAILPSPTPADTGGPTPSSSAEPPLADELAPIGAVVATDPLVMRTAPGTGADSTILPTRLYPGMRFVILAGPSMASDYAWYRVRLGDVEGWAAAASREGEPWLASVQNGLVAISRHVPDGADAPHPQVFLVDQDGNERQVTNMTADEVSREIASRVVIQPALTCGYGISGGQWSPNGESLAAAVGGCDSAMFVVDASAGPMRWMGPGRDPAWTPDGGALVHGLNIPYLLCGRQCGGDVLGPWEITLTQIATGARRSLTVNGPWFSATQPAWSPDGSRVAFVGGPVDAETRAIYVARADGTAQARVADGYSPAWSPDGTSLLVVRPEGSGADTYLVKADGSDHVDLGPGFAASWSPDGRMIALATPDERTVLLSLDGSQLADLGPGRPAGWSPDGRALMVSREDMGVLLAVGLTDGTQRVVATFGEADGWWSYLAWQPVVVPLG